MGALIDGDVMSWQSKPCSFTGLPQLRLPALPQGLPAVWTTAHLEVQVHYLALAKCD